MDVAHLFFVVKLQPGNYMVEAAMYNSFAQRSRLLRLQISTKHIKKGTKRHRKKVRITHLLWKKPK
jgi:hypothetical protein